MPAVLCVLCGVESSVPMATLALTVLQGTGCRNRNAEVYTGLQAEKMGSNIKVTADPCR